MQHDRSHWLTPGSCQVSCVLSQSKSSSLPILVQVFKCKISHEPRVTIFWFANIKTCQWAVKKSENKMLVRDVNVKLGKVLLMFNNVIVYVWFNLKISMTTFLCFYFHFWRKKHASLCSTIWRLIAIFLLHRQLQYNLLNFFMHGIMCICLQRINWTRQKRYDV